MPFRFGKGAGKCVRNRQCRKIGSETNCICPRCNTLIPHQRGIPCFQTNCPNCGTPMTRKFDISDNADI